MSKYLSKAAAKRLPLNTKRARKGYYKGKGGTKEGKLNSRGKFLVDPLKRLELMVPDLEGFKVGTTSLPFWENWGVDKEPSSSHSSRTWTYLTLFSF